MTTSGLFGQLDIGKRSLMSQQAGMNVAGHNIANLNNEDFSRQRVELSPEHPGGSRFGMGVKLDRVRRLTDGFLTERLIKEQSRGGMLDIRQQGLERLGNLFNDLEGEGLRGVLNQFWDAWGSLANSPETEIYRTDLINAGRAVAERISGLSHDLLSLREEFNGRISERIEKINQLASRIAVLNARVQQLDRGKGEANDLRDEREALLKELAVLAGIEWLEDDNKLINVTIGAGWPLVHGRKANRLEASFNNKATTSDDAALFSIRGIDPKGISRDLTAELSGGELTELLRMRDEIVVGFDQRVNQMASELSFEVNRLHVAGTGLNAHFEVLDSTFALKPDALNRPLPFIRDGVFRFSLVNDDNEYLETYEVELVAGQDTLPDIVARINQTVGDPGLASAVLNRDGSVSLRANGPYDIVLGEDETDFAVVMGFNNFFENLNGARDFRINERLVKNPNAISTGKSLLPGDNSIALAIHQLQFKPTMQDNSITFDEFYNGITTELGLRMDRSLGEQRNQQLIIDQFQKLRNEVSSVNMDEEVADMVQYQRGFDAAARFISTVDEMTQTVIDM